MGNPVEKGVLPNGAGIPNGVGLPNGAGARKQDELSVTWSAVSDEVSDQFSLTGLACGRLVCGWLCCPAGEPTARLLILLWDFC